MASFSALRVVVFFGGGCFGWFLFLFLFCDRVLCNPGWPWIYYVAQNELHFLTPPVDLPWGWNNRHTIPLLAHALLSCTQGLLHAWQTLYQLELHPHLLVYVMNLCVPIWWVDALPVAAWEAKLVHSGSLRTLGLDDSKCSSWWLPPNGRACAHRASQPCTFTCLRCSTSPRCLQDLPWQHSESPRVSLRHQGEGKEAE